jgi:predicted nucleic acid-binding protein
VNSRVCVDANLALKLVLAVRDSAQVRSLWEKWNRNGFEILAPPLLMYEGASAIRGQIYRGLVSQERGDFAFQAFQAQGVTLVSTPGIYQRAWDIAKQLNQPKVYDSCYLALAEILDCEFWTADERLFNAVKDKFPRVKWIGRLQTS